MSTIDTKKCPVYMLTGEYDWSNTPAMGQETCDKIPGGMHKAMKGVGHFPATENPGVFVGYCECFLDPFSLLLGWVDSGLCEEGDDCAHADVLCSARCCGAYSEGAWFLMDWLSWGLYECSVLGWVGRVCWRNKIGNFVDSVVYDRS